MEDSLNWRRKRALGVVADRRARDGQPLSPWSRLIGWLYQKHRFSSL